MSSIFRYYIDLNNKAEKGDSFLNNQARKNRSHSSICLFFSLVLTLFEGGGQKFSEDFYYIDYFQNQRFFESLHTDLLLKA